jgi:predicted neutral ceramidase superfamily lipid hydrolase
MTFKQWISKSLKDALNRKGDQLGSSPSKFATFLVILSSIVVFLDKIFVVLDLILDKFNKELIKPIPEKYMNLEYDFHAFIFLISVTWIAPILLIIAFRFKPYKISYIAPLYSYSVLGFFLFISKDTVDNRGWFFAYGFFTMLIVFFIIEYIKYKLRKHFEQKIAKTKKKLNELY